MCSCVSMQYLCRPQGSSEECACVPREVRGRPVGRLSLSGLVTCAFTPATHALPASTLFPEAGTWSFRLCWLTSKPQESSCPCLHKSGCYVRKWTESIQLRNEVAKPVTRGNYAEMIFQNHQKKGNEESIKVAKDARYESHLYFFILCKMKTGCV